MTSRCPTKSDARHNSFAYDTAGRLTAAVIANRDPATGAPTGTNRTIGYGFGPADASCPAAPNAGKNTNRTRLTVDGVTQAIYCYDNADRLVSTTQTGYSSTIAYDGHGNTTTIAGETRGYDSADRHQSTTKAGTTVEYLRDATDRIVARKLNGTTTERYAYGGSGDAPAMVLDGNSNLAQLAWALSGGVVLTRAATDTWSYPNIHGDVALVTNGSGAKQGPVRTYDPYGNPDTTLVDNVIGNMDWAWLGSHQRPLEHQTGLAPTIEMGARQYDPTLGRFLEVDPVEMGSANDYEYCAGDPRNCVDLDGRYSWSTGWFNLVGVGIGARVRVLGQGCGRVLRWVCDHYRVLMTRWTSLQASFCILSSANLCADLLVGLVGAAISGALSRNLWGSAVGFVVGTALSVGAG